MIVKVGRITDPVFDRYYRDLLDDGHIPVGLNLPVCLVVTGEVINCLLDQTQENEQPYMVVVGKDIYKSDRSPLKKLEHIMAAVAGWESEGIEGIYHQNVSRGRFRADICVLLNVVWSIFAARIMAPDEIVPVADRTQNASRK